MNQHKILQVRAVSESKPSCRHLHPLLPPFLILLLLPPSPFFCQWSRIFENWDPPHDFVLAVKLQLEDAPLLVSSESSFPFPRNPCRNPGYLMSKVRRDSTRHVLFDHCFKFPGPKRTPFGVRCFVLLNTPIPVDLSGVCISNQP
jgi:hypothetical protein